MALSDKAHRLHLFAILTLAACGGGTGDTAGSSDVSASGYTVVEVQNGGSITGSVRFSGTVPAPRAVNVTDDFDACGATVEVSDLEVGSERGLANAVVSLVDVTSGAAVSSSASPTTLDTTLDPTLDQRGCRFHPHVIIAGVGQTVGILNSDPVTHNVHTVAFDNRTFNRSQPPSLERIEASFEVTEKVMAKCDIHGWMSAWIVVVDHPYHDITSEDGTFTIDDVPPGTYTLEIWHEALGSTRETVTVTGGETTDVRVELAQSSQ